MAKKDKLLKRLTHHVAEPALHIIDNKQHTKKRTNIRDKHQIKPTRVAIDVYHSGFWSKHNRR